MLVKCMSSLISVMSPCLPVFPVCAYGGVVRYSLRYSFPCEFVSCIVMMSGCVLYTRFFSSSILFLMPLLLL